MQKSRDTYRPKQGGIKFQERSFSCSVFSFSVQLEQEYHYGEIFQM